MILKRILSLLFLLLINSSYLYSQEISGTPASLKSENVLTPTIVVSVPKILEQKIDQLEQFSIIAICSNAISIILLLVVVGVQRRTVDKIRHEVERTQILLEEELEDLRPLPKVRSIHNSLYKKYSNSTSVK